MLQYDWLDAIITAELKKCSTPACVAGAIARAPAFQAAVAEGLAKVADPDKRGGSPAQGVRQAVVKLFTSPP